MHARPPESTSAVRVAEASCSHPRPRRYVAVAGDLVSKSCARCGARLGEPVARCMAMVTTATGVRRRCLAAAGACRAHGSRP